MNALLFNATPFQCLPVCSSITVEVSHPYRCWCLTHTPNGVSLIELSANQGVVFSHSTSSHKTPFRHLRSRLLASTTASHSPSLPRPFRHLRSRLLVSTAASHSSSLLCHTRHLRFVPFVISSFSLPSSPSSVTRHLPALSLVISQLCHSSSPSSDARHLPRDND